MGSTGCQTSHWLVKKQDAWSVFGHMPFQSESSIDPSERTHQTLKRLVLGEELEEDPEQAFAQLQKILQQEPSAEVLYAYAEMAYLLATTVEEEDEKRAFDLYVTSAANACEYLFDERFHATRNAYDPQFRGACDLYNHSLASAMRMINHHGGLKPGLQHFCNVGTESTLFRISSQVEHLKQDNIKKLDFVSDYEISGLPNHYRTYGLGVPLIVERRPDNKRAMLEKHYPPGLTIPSQPICGYRHTGNRMPTTPPFVKRSSNCTIHYRHPMCKLQVNGSRWKAIPRHRWPTFSIIWITRT